MSNWITNRTPEEADADRYGYVWVRCSDGGVYKVGWNNVTNEPWMPTNQPKRYKAVWLAGAKCWGIYDGGDSVVTMLYMLSDEDKHREAAKRIAAIYEEVMH